MCNPKKEMGDNIDDEENNITGTQNEPSDIDTMKRKFEAETQLEEAKQEKTILDERGNEMAEMLKRNEQCLASQVIDIRKERMKLLSELEENKRLIEELQAERAMLETHLVEAKLEKATLDKRCNEMAETLERDEHLLASQVIETSKEREKLQSELEENKRLIEELQAERAMLETQLVEAKLEKATLDKRCNEMAETLERDEHLLASQVIGNSKQREKLQSELEEKKELIKELQGKVAKLEQILEQFQKQREKGTVSDTVPFSVFDCML
ncbi:flagellar attachment zone protein 1-like [Ptychodera flava]|uniref:flagellar attachment zone protein 1-like n=1 Tax=Ptychodera flava TaxID=63121 RepID=UPI00396A7E73